MTTSLSHPDTPCVTDFADKFSAFPVLESQEVFTGKVFSMLSEKVQYGDGVATRDFVQHPGAVAIVPLREGVAGESGEPEVLFIDQYRHPVGATLWEIPAGLLDVDGEDPLTAAQRELAEEADLQAGRWDVLVDYFTTPGGSSEALRVFLARDLSPIPAEQRSFQREAEEALMTSRWVPLSEAVTAIFTGRIHNPSAVVGVLATALAIGSRGGSPVDLRSPQAPWFKQNPRGSRS